MVHIVEVVSSRRNDLQMVSGEEEREMKFDLFDNYYTGRDSSPRRGGNAWIRVTVSGREEEREILVVKRFSLRVLCLRAVISGGMCAIVTLHVIPVHMLYRPGTRNSLQ